MDWFCAELVVVFGVGVVACISPLLVVALSEVDLICRVVGNMALPVALVPMVAIVVMSWMMEVVVAILEVVMTR